MANVMLDRVHPSSASVFILRGWWIDGPAFQGQDWREWSGGRWAPKVEEEVRRGAADAGYGYGHRVFQAGGDVLVILGTTGESLDVIVQHVDTGSQLARATSFEVPLSRTVHLLLGRLGLGVEAAAAISIEVLVSDMLRDLQAENSALRSALENARIDIAFLEGQLHALNEAKATGHKSITKSVVSVVVAVLLAAGGGAAGGAAQAIAEHRMTDRAPTPSLAEYIEQCQAIQSQLGN